MWLPTFIGMNQQLVKEIEDAIAPAIVGKELNEETLDDASHAVLDFLVKKFPTLPGLYNYLDGLKFVTNNGGA